jgi:hypothetical protein
VIEFWVERVKQGKPVELPWRPLRQTVDREGAAFVGDAIGWQVSRRARTHRQAADGHD